MRESFNTFVLLFNQSLKVSTELVKQKKLLFFMLFLMSNLLLIGKLFSIGGDLFGSLSTIVYFVGIAFFLDQFIPSVAGRERSHFNSVSYIKYTLICYFLISVGFYFLVAPGIIMLIAFSFVPLAAMFSEGDFKEIFKVGVNCAKENLLLCSWLVFMSLMVKEMDFYFELITNIYVKNGLLMMYSIPKIFLMYTFAGAFYLAFEKYQVSLEAQKQKRPKFLSAA